MLRMQQEGQKLPRRTVTISSRFDEAVRRLQARLLLSLKRDVPYTESLNYVWFHGFLRPWPDGKTVVFWKEGNPEATEEEVMHLKNDFDSNQLRFDGWLDGMGSYPEDGPKFVSYDPDDAVPARKVGETNFRLKGALDRRPKIDLTPGSQSVDKRRSDR